MNKKRLLSLVLAVSFSTSCFATGVARADGGKQNSPDEIQKKRLEMLFENQNDLKAKKTDEGNLNKLNPNERVRVIVQLESKPAYEITKDKNLSYSALQTEREKVVNGQAIIKKEVESLTGDNIKKSFGYLVNGFSTTVERHEIDEIKKIPGVKKVSEANTYKLDMNYSEELTQTKEVWNEIGYKGEGTVVAVIDSGIDVHHKDMRLTDPKKAKIKEPCNSDSTLKVPYTHNYADDNNDVLDRNPQTEMHGMHVAGIIGANGKDEEIASEKAIKGVAPEAQLLAMKVFTNNPDAGSAYEDDIVAAIEDSVALGADVINMSLGAPAGFVSDDDIEQTAIKEAVDQGVVVVVSEGNSSYSTYPNKYAEVPDTGITGNPAISTDAFAVASYENTNVRSVGLDYSSDKGNGISALLYSTCEVDPIGVLTDKNGYSLVDCGIGQPSDFTGKDLKGKIALIKRGTLDFVTKKKNAQAAGAIGVIVYNQSTEERSDGGDELSSMAQSSEVTIPAVFIGNTDGITLKGLIASNVKISFKGSLTTKVNPSAQQMSYFTSWGPGPNLEFKPEITGVGGKIWSTANGDKYQSMSGTSMAAPDVSGGEALIVGAKKAQGIDLEGRELVDFAKNTSINTSKILLDAANGNVPYSPRQQGAGLIQMKDAINNNVTITYDGRAVAALKEIGKEETFELKLHNYGNNPVTYEPKNGGILTEIKTSINKAPYDLTIPGADMKFDKDSITVEPGNDEVIKVTMTLPNNFESEQFVEGYVKFTSKTEGAPSLSVPYMGFYGEWAKPTIIDKPVWDSAHILSGSRIIFSCFGKDFNLGEYTDEDGNIHTNTDCIAIAPGQDWQVNNVAPDIVPIRDAKKIITEVIDSKGNVIRTLGVENNYRKVSAKDGETDRLLSSGTWDGMVYNPSKGEYEAAKDGQYYLRVKSYMTDDVTKEQAIEMPVKVDTIAPKIGIISDGTTDSPTNYELTWTANDNIGGSGLYLDTKNGQLSGGVVLNVNGTETWYPTLKIGNDNTFSTPINLKVGKNTVKVRVIDNAMNETTVTKEITVTGDPNPAVQPDVVFADYNLKDNGVCNYLKNGKYTVRGSVSSKVKSLTINEIPAVIDASNGAFTVDVPVTDQEYNTLTVSAKDSANVEIYNHAFKVLVDTIKPTMTLTSPETLPTDATDQMWQKFNGKIIINSSTLKLQGVVSDKFIDKLYINAKETKIESDGSFSTELTVKGPDEVIISVKDKGNNYYIQRYYIIADVKDEKLTYYMSGLQSDMIVTDPIEENGKYYTEVSGALSKNIKRMEIQGKQIQINNLQFDQYIELKEGLNKVPVYIEELDGTVALDYEYSVWMDLTAPEINLSSPCVIKSSDDSSQEYCAVADNEGNVTLAGTVADNVFGYNFYINGNMVINGIKYHDAGLDETLKPFNVKIPAKVGDVIELKASDLLGNQTIRKIKVVDSANNAQLVSITNKTGVDKFIIGNDAKVTISAENKSMVTRKASLIIGLFDANNRFINYTCSTQEIEAGKTVELTGMLSLPKSGEGYKVKVFVWDSLEDGNPLSDAIEIPVVNP